MINLIKNEFIKEYTNKRIIFITGLFAVISLGFILLNGALDSAVMEETDNKTILENYKHELKIDQENYAKNKTVDNLQHIKTREIMIEYQQSIVDKNLSYDDWRYNALGNLMLLKLKMSSLLMIQSGADSNDFTTGTQYADYSMDQVNREIESYQSKINKLMEALDSNKYYNYEAYQIDDYNEELKSINNEMELGQTDYYRSLQANVLEEKIKAGNFIVNHKIATNNDRRVKEAKIIYSDIEAKRELLSEIDFGKELFDATQYDSYNQYKEMVTAYNNNIDKEIEMSWYAIVHNFPHASSKFLNAIDDSYIVFIIVTLLMIIRASSTLVSEYHSGTIKLLLTKGSSRLKIITSKIINIILSSYMLSLMFLIIFIIVGSFFFDISDLLAPKLAVINGIVIEKSYILWLFKNILIVTLPMIFLCSLSFLLASITSNGIIASGTTIFLSLVGLNMMSFIIGSYMYFLKYTPFAYLNMTGFVSHHMGVNNYPLTPSLFSLNSGITILLISTIICYGIGIIIFKTRDVKN